MHRLLSVHDYFSSESISFTGFPTLLFQSVFLLELSHFNIAMALGACAVIKKRQLKWYGHLVRLEDSRWPKTIYQWTPHGKRRRERPQQSWKNQVKDFMRSRNIE